MALALRRVSGLLLLSAGLASVACDDGPNPEFVRADQALRETMAKTGDLSYEHPDFDGVEKLFRAVPEDAEEHPVAILIADRIHKARLSAIARGVRRKTERQQLEGVAQEAEREARRRYLERRNMADEREPAVEAKAEKATDQRDAKESLETVLELRQRRVRRHEAREAKRRAQNDEAIRALEAAKKQREAE